jgi:hypothetical protein
VNQTDNNPPRRLRIFLRDHRVLDASARVPRGQFLSTYLASRTRYVNLMSSEWVGIGEQVGHMALKVDKILWAASEDGELPLTGAVDTPTPRTVEVELEGGYLVSAGLLLVENQRLSDYLQSAPPFVPLRNAELRPRGKKLGDVVVNQEAIQVVREIHGGAPDVDRDARDAGEETLKREYPGESAHGQE